MVTTLRAAWHAGPVSERHVPPAVIAAATKRAGLIWITVPGAARPRAAWHVWLDGAAYVLTGPGEQQVPGLDTAPAAAVTVPSKDTGGQLLTWDAAVSRVDPAGPGWTAVAAALLAGRLNPPGAPGGGGPGGGGPGGRARGGASRRAVGAHRGGLPAHPRHGVRPGAAVFVA